MRIVGGFWRTRTSHDLGDLRPQLLNDLLDRFARSLRGFRVTTICRGSAPGVIDALPMVDTNPSTLGSAMICATWS
jgi:hypothetical protein